MYGDDVMTVQLVRKWHRLFENGQMNIHDDDRAGVPTLQEQICEPRISGGIGFCNTDQTLQRLLIL